MIKTILVGNLGQDAKVRPLERGALFTFSVAADTYIEGRTVPEWESVKYFCGIPAYAEVLKSRLVKGTMVFVEGEPRTETYTDEDDNLIKSRKLYAQVVKVLHGPAAAPAEAPRSGQQTPRPQPASRVPAEEVPPDPNFMGLQR
ncbi:MAG TPA: single-stranded DNA-binding protein [Rhodanobacteraceae bacterium]|mgnify:CR=1 FL=1|nr:single-stranded DNA-binding protein [Rhodanobacteraceae bacterium]